MILHISSHSAVLTAVSLIWIFIFKRSLIRLKRKQGPTFFSKTITGFCCCTFMNCPHHVPCFWRFQRVSVFFLKPCKKQHCVQIYSFGKERPLSPSQYPQAFSNKYFLPLIDTIPFTKCCMLYTL